MSGYAIFWQHKTRLKFNGHGKPIFTSFEDAKGIADEMNADWPTIHHHAARVAGASHEQD